VVILYCQCSNVKNRVFY